MRAVWAWRGVRRGLGVVAVVRARRRVRVRRRVWRVGSILAGGWVGGWVD